MKLYHAEIAYVMLLNSYSIKYAM